jgi:hypothetical protein
MNTQVYVVVKKYNHFQTFPPSLIPSPVVTWNAGSLYIEGVFTTYPVKYAYNPGYEIHGPFPLNGFNMVVRDPFQSIPSQPGLNYPSMTPFDFNHGY